MELGLLLQYLLPGDLSLYFDLVEAKNTDTEILHLYLDEKKIIPPEHLNKQIISYGFTDPVHIQDFPLRGKQVYLVVRRRKWKDKSTDTIYTREWNITAKGTSYSKEFATFLKEVFRQSTNK